MNALLEKSIKVRNELAIQKLANKDSNREWGNTKQPDFPVYKTCNGIKNDKIWRHFLRGIINGAKQLRP